LLQIARINQLNQTMQDFRHMELNALVDMLSSYTTKFSKMLVDGCSEEEYNSCKRIIELLQAEIESRKKKMNKAVISGPERTAQPGE
jgi:hypothetical protein